MRVSGNAVRLAALVAAATASGYLWRAALESPSRTTIIRLAPRPSQPRVQIVASAHHPVSEAAPATRGSGRVAQPQHGRHGPAQVSQRVAAPAQSATLASNSRPAAPARPAPTPKPAPSPKPAPKPSTPPPAPPATQSQPPPAAAPAAPTPSPGASGPPAGQSGSGKPGWGNGDKNHDHGGPPGDGHGK